MLKSEDKIAYCMKCKKKQIMENPIEDFIVGQKGHNKRVARGVCSVCQTKMMKILKREEEE